MDKKAKIVAIVQSNYIPWKGYFDLINSVDEFILLDDVQYTRRDWRNRNKIKTQSGAKWITIPVEVKGKYLQKVNETKISDKGWNRQHWETIRTNYAHAPYFRQYKQFFEDLYLSCDSSLLSEINWHFLDRISKLLQINTRICWSSEYQLSMGKNERLISLCQQAGAIHYISGPLAKDYLDTAAFAAEGIAVTFIDYSGYPEYPQLYPPFDHAVSIVDLILNAGPDTASFMKSF